MAKRGRPTLLDKRLKEMAIRIANEKGMTLKKLASLLGIGQTSLRMYLRNDADFSRALKEVFENNENMPNALVEISLYRRATGYTFASEKIFCTPSGAIRRVKTVEHCPPDVKAAVTWLERQDPENWAEKSGDESPDEKPIQLDYDDQKL